MGGTQSLHTNSYDEALALPSEEAVRIALRTQQILAEESGLADTVDPLGGSYAVEALTDEMEAEAMAYIEEIEEMGEGSILDGILRGIDEGYFHREIQDSAFEYQRRVDDGEETVVGVNEYVSDEEEETDLLHVSDEVRERQLERLERVKAERDDEEVEATLAALDDAIRDGENTMPYVVDAVKAYATMGEIMQVFEAEHGSYTETVGLA
jgi:methylmalonyl-CoA mutase N-terminal domain/subunit